ncbi:MAG: radical SAM protein [Candidatus Buchananbacteria bacterium]
MKIFILNPYLFTGKLGKLSRKRQPLELAYLASLLRQNYQVKLLDANALNLDLSQTLKEIKEFAPEILILTSTPIDRWEVPSHKHLELLVKNILNIIDKVKINHVILLGSHGTVMPEWILRQSHVNFVVRGEPEITTVNLVQALISGRDLKQIKGISYLESDLIVNNPDAVRNYKLDDLPFPAYDSLPMDKYRYTFSDIPTPFSLMMASRGCPFSCTYCLKAMMPGAYIVRSPENVFLEIKYLIEKFKVRGIYFQDWEFTINQKWVEQICDLIISNNLVISWGCNARASDVKEGLVKKMKAAGCVRINLGFESGSQKVLDLAHKQIKLDSVKEAVAVCRRQGIKVGIYSILNLPGETRKTIAETEKFLADNNLQTMSAPNLPIPYFGTELYEMLKRQQGKDFDWQNLEKFAGRVGVAQAPWLARLYRWHYKYKYSFGSWYFFRVIFYLQLFRSIKARI